MKSSLLKLNFIVFICSFFILPCYAANNSGDIQEVEHINLSFAEQLAAIVLLELKLL